MKPAHNLLPSILLRVVATLVMLGTFALTVPALAINGGNLRVNPRNGWLAFEVISVGDNPAGDGFTWSMPGSFDGVGAWLPDATTLRLQINHETSDATISEVNLDRTSFEDAIGNMISIGNTGGVTFVRSARQAYDRWSSNGGVAWTNTTSVSNTSFERFCSGQSYNANTFGPGRGFVDELYITGEEVDSGRLFALDLPNRDYYQLSGVSGSGNGGIGGMPFDRWENAALVDTGESNHVALLLSPDGGTEIMKIYIGEKGKDANGNASSGFLARNGLAFGSYYYLNDTLPMSGISTNGRFDTTTAGALQAAKLEDVDTSPSQPNRVAIGVQETGLFTFDFALDFSFGNFNAGGSSFSITKIQNHVNDTDGEFGDADNVDWTAATTLNGVNYPEGLIFVNEDSGTAGGEIWVNRPNGSSLIKIGDTIGVSGATETSGILDISRLVGYNPGSVLLTSNQGTSASLSVLINPNATRMAIAGDYNENGVVDAADYVAWRNSLGQIGVGLAADGNDNREIDAGDYLVWIAHFGQTYGSGALLRSSIPEPATLLMLLLPMFGWFHRQRSDLLCSSVIH